MTLWKAKPVGERQSAALKSLTVAARETQSYSFVALWE